MKNSWRRLVAASICIAMVAGGVPAYVLADNSEEPQNDVPVLEETDTDAVIEEAQAPSEDEVIEEIQTPSQEVSEDASFVPGKTVDEIYAGGTYHMMENLRGWWDVDSSGNEIFIYNPEAATSDENGNFYTFLVENPDMEFVVMYTDGSYLYGTAKYIFQQTGESLRFSLGNQMNKPLVPDKDLIMYVSFGGVTSTMKAIIDPNPVESISTESPFFDLMENTGGYWLTDKAGQIYYNYPVFSECYPDPNQSGRYCFLSNYDYVAFTIWYKDGTSFSGTAKQIYEATGIAFEPEWPNQNEEHWTAGNTYTVNFSYLGARIDLYYYIDESPYEIIPGNNEIHYYENANGYWDVDADQQEFFYYYVTYSNGDYCWLGADPDMVFTVKYKDGSKPDLVGTAKEIWEATGESLTITKLDDSQKWVLGGEYEVMITLNGAACTVFAVVDPNPIKEVICEKETIAFDQFTNGEWVSDGLGGTFYRYEIIEDCWTVDEKKFQKLKVDPDMVYTIKYKDARPDLVGTAEEIFLQTGISLQFSEDVYQYDHHWDEAGEYLINVSYLGAWSKLTIDLIENPVESISCASQIEIPEYGNVSWGVDNNGSIVCKYGVKGVQWVSDTEYYTYLADAPDLVYTISFRDESEDLVGTAEEIYEQTGISLKFSYDEVQDPSWKAGDTKDIVVSYRGISTTIKATIVPGEVESITCSNAIHYSENEGGDWFDLPDGNQYYWYEVVRNENNGVQYQYPAAAPDLIFTVHYRDGRDDLVGTAGQIALATGKSLEFYEITSQSLDPWKPGKTYKIAVTFQGAAGLIDVIIDVVPEMVLTVEDTVYVDLDDIETILWAFDFEGEPFIIYEIPDVPCVLTYKDGTTVEASSFSDLYDKTGYEVELRDDNQFVEPWYPGETHEVTGTFGDQEISFNVTIPECPIESIVLDPGSFVVKEGEYCYPASTTVYDGEGNETIKKWLRYEVHPLLEGASCVITYKDSSEDAFFISYDEDAEFPELLAHGVTSQDYHALWKVGEHEFVFYYRGYIIHIPFTIEERQTIEPGTITGVTVAPKSGVTMQIRWDAFEGAVKYEVKGTAAGSAEQFELIKTTGASQTSCSHTGLTAGTIYTYVILAYDAEDNLIAQSDCKSAAALATPVINSTAMVPEGIELSWSKASGADRYNIYRSTSEDGPFDYIASVQKTETFVDTAIEPDVKYYYKVRAYKKADGNTYYGGYSVAAEMTYTTISNLNVAPKSGVTMLLSWSAVDGVYVYEVWAAADGSAFAKVKETGKTQTSCSHTGLTAGTRYSYYIVAKTKDGRVLAISSQKKAVALATPTLNSAESKGIGIVLSWTKASGADRYNIYRSTSENGTYEYITSVQKTETYTDTAVTSGTTYYYKVRAYKKIDGIVYYGGYSNSLSAEYTMKKVPNLKAVPKSGVTMTLAWGAVDDVYTYDVLYSVDGGEYTLAKSTGKSQTSCSHTGLTAGKCYSYMIVAKNKAGDVIAISDEVKAVALATPTLTSAEGSEEGIALSWTKASGADRYNIYRSTSENGTYEYVTSVQKVENYTDTQVEAGVTYYYKVRAYKRVDGVVYYGGYSNALSAKKS
ncbi:MAG: hypothetical protein J5379_00365 [Clostridiales bacterium]|nr:hypothetical protein [Clostridiales bacterium]